MKIILFMAMSVNGLAARNTGQEDFLSNENWQTLIELDEKINCLIIGRKTYEAIKEWNDYNFEFFAQAAKIIVSGQAGYQVDEGCYLVNSPEAAVAKAQELGHDQAILMGGPHLNTSFAKAGLIDEMIINIEPVLIGFGMNIFARDEELELHWMLVGGGRVKGDLMQLRYAIKK